MEDYTWHTENSHSDNTETMIDYLNNHLPRHFAFLFQDRSYAEVFNEVTSERFGIHASGNGNFNNHKVRFEKL